MQPKPAWLACQAMPGFEDGAGQEVELLELRMRERERVIVTCAQVAEPPGGGLPSASVGASAEQDGT
jgi:hypothetical protein